MNITSLKHTWVFLSLLILVVTSCGKHETIEPKDKSSSPSATASLEVTVTGKTGNVRDNIRVAIYETEEDAKNKKGEVKSEQRTDSNGKTTFTDIVPSNRYWVRADALFSKNIKETNSLETGKNVIRISVW